MKTIKNVLIIDDDEDTRKLFSHILKRAGYHTEVAESAATAMKILQTVDINVILLDLLMPGINGLEFCGSLQSDRVLSRIPVIMITSRSDDETRRNALNAGIADFISKLEINSKTLLAVVEKVLNRSNLWERLDSPVTSARAQDYKGFIDFLRSNSTLSKDDTAAYTFSNPNELYDIASNMGLDSTETAKLLSNFLRIPNYPYIDPEAVEGDMLPAAFSKSHRVLALREKGEIRFVLSNPYEAQLIDMLESLTGKVPVLGITCPDCIDALLRKEDNQGGKSALASIDTGSEENQVEPEKDDVEDFSGSIEITEKPSEEDIRKYPIKYISDSILFSAVTEGASDIHIEPKPKKVVVRFRVDGDMKDMFTLKKKTGAVLISRFKVLGGMDIAERRKPQDGQAEASIAGKPFKMRFATTSTPQGESLVVRMLDMYAKPRELTELGMTEQQSRDLYEVSSQSSGAIIVVGPTGSGKSTTLYSMISHLDIKSRSLITIEDPVEYRIAYANQQQVNERAGVTFEALLKSAVRQDPDIIYLGEVRDSFSAKTCLDLASTGHLTMATLHSSNTTTALFRLARLGISREDSADNLLCLLAQRLLKSLCQSCRRMKPITQEERKILLPFLNEEDIPTELPHPEGCPKCNFTGYAGRQGVYELMRFNPRVTEIIKSAESVPAMRIDLHEKANVFLLSDHAIMKVKQGLLSLDDVNRNVLLEELRLSGRQDFELTEKEVKADRKKKILLVDDDEDFRKLATILLETAGYEIEQVSDGVEAIITLQTNNYDLILSDIEMPGLDGFTMLHALQSKNLDTPLIFLTGNDSMDKEEKGYELGAVDYIRKPIRRKMFLTRVSRALG
ncbi:MAG: Flp pilus assembly complex ATPase component TadA [Candidatus Fermentibacteraceae bacterium]|nr:Flp pilus assembly complex ATPase component TadA [Candidatus Fermentibacteraceae bacterium]